MQFVDFEQLATRELEQLCKQLEASLAGRIETRVQELDRKLTKLSAEVGLRHRAAVRTDIAHMSAAQFERAFPTEDACKAYLQARRWPKGVCCPCCGSRNVSSASQPFTWHCGGACKARGYHFSVRVGTVFEHSHLPLRVWFRVLHMISKHPDLTAAQMRKVFHFLNTSTIHSVCHRLRQALCEAPELLGGTVSRPPAVPMSCRRSGSG